MNITINQEQRLFVIGYGEGFSCLGFDVVYNHCLALAQKIKKYAILKTDQTLVPPTKEDIGTIKQYNQYQDYLNLVTGKNIGTYFSFETPVAVQRVLEKCRKEGTRIRLFYGDTKTGRSWMDEHDMMGRIGRSGGTMKIPLLLSEGENGGGGILDNCVIRIIDIETKKDLFCHKLFHVPKMEIRSSGEENTHAGYPFGIWAETTPGTFTNQANFSTQGKAAAYLAFMTGDSMSQPN